RCARRAVARPLRLSVARRPRGTVPDPPTSSKSPTTRHPPCNLRGVTRIAEHPAHHVPIGPVGIRWDGHSQDDAAHTPRRVVSGLTMKGITMTVQDSSRERRRGGAIDDSLIDALIGTRRLVTPSQRMPEDNRELHKQ